MNKREVKNIDSRDEWTMWLHLDDGSVVEINPLLLRSVHIENTSGEHEDACELCNHPFRTQSDEPYLLHNTVNDKVYAVCCYCHAGQDEPIDGKYLAGGDNVNDN